MSARGPALRARAPAKINLGLFVGPVRADGRHELVSVMQSLSLADELELREATEGGGVERESPGDAARRSGDRIVCPAVQGPPEQNLAARALAAFRAATGWGAPPLELTIDKRVPVAAGLGGGSGDAAATLRLAAAASGEGTPGLLRELAGELGADVPAQVDPGRWLASGAGESLEPLPHPREPLGVLMLPGATGLSTAAVYAHADRLGRRRTHEQLAGIRQALARALGEGAALPPAELLENDLQLAACALCPEIERALAQGVAAGADVAVVSGSGPTVVGLFGGPGGVSRARAAALALQNERTSAGAPPPIAAEPVGGDFAAVRGGVGPMGGGEGPARGGVGRSMRHNSRG